MLVFDTQSSRKMLAEPTLDLSLSQKKNPSCSPTSFSVHGQIPRAIARSLTLKQRALRIASLSSRVCPGKLLPLVYAWRAQRRGQLGSMGEPRGATVWGSGGQCPAPQGFGCGTLKIHFPEDQDFVSVGQCRTCKLCLKAGLLTVQPGSPGKARTESR